MRVPTYVMPRVYHAAYRRYFESLCALDQGGADDGSGELANVNRTYKLVAAECDSADAAAEPIALGKNRVLRCLRTVHRVESVAYCVLEQKRSLKAHMRGKTTDEIREAALRGEEVSESVLAPLVAYTGDTTVEGVIQHQLLLDVPVLIMECTIWDESLSPALTAERGHIHLHHLNDHADRFNNKHVVLTHCSPRHNPAVLADALDSSRFAAVLRGKGAAVYIL
jgi:ribonuclease BN (tRNA processing enzyme)